MPPPMTFTYHAEQLFSSRDSLSSLGRFGLGRALGSGPSSTVYAGYDPEKAREVVVCLMDCGSGPSASTRVDSVLQQVEAWRTLGHACLVKIVQVGTYQDPRRPGSAGVFLVRDHVHGMDMQAWLDALTTPCAIPWSQVLGMFVSVGRAIELAHNAGLVHGGFSPASVIVGYDGRTHLLDFACHGASALEATTMSAARAAYAAPEVVAGRPASAASDQYSFAATVWTGLGRVAGGKLPKRVSAILERAMSEDPAVRWPSMATMLEALDRSGQGILRRTIGSFAGAA